MGYFDMIKTPGTQPFSHYSSLIAKPPVMPTAIQPNSQTGQVNIPQTTPFQQAQPIGTQQAGFSNIGGNASPMDMFPQSTQQPQSTQPQASEQPGFRAPELEGLKHTMPDKGFDMDFGSFMPQPTTPTAQPVQPTPFQKPIGIKPPEEFKATPYPDEKIAEYQRRRENATPEELASIEKGIDPFSYGDESLPIGDKAETQEQLDATIGGGFSEATAPEWGTEGYQQAMYNLAREQQSGQTAADVEYARTKLGGRGFRAGESGIANKALMNLRRMGSERLGQQSRQLALQGMGARYGQQQDQMNMLMRLYGMDVEGQQRRFNPYFQQELQAGSPGYV